MSGQVSRGSAGEYQADERAGVAVSAGEYQADEQAGVARLSMAKADVVCFIRLCHDRCEFSIGRFFQPFG